MVPIYHCRSKASAKLITHVNADAPPHRLTVTRQQQRQRRAQARLALTWIFAIFAAQMNPSHNYKHRIIRISFSPFQQGYTCTLKVLHWLAALRDHRKY
jgi:hypothetical protein